ncbi:MAG: hypothetical protein AAF804_08880 [Bacteroidota bacterium]
MKASRIRIPACEKLSSALWGTYAYPQPFGQGNDSLLAQAATFCFGSLFEGLINMLREITDL